MRARLAERLRASGGFTLIELLVVTVILSIVLGAVAVGFTSALTGEGRAISRATGEENARLALARLRLDLHCASGVNGLNENADGGWTITLNIDPNACPQVSLQENAIGIQWCTVRLGEKRWRLYRENALDCDASHSDFMVDYLVEANPWTLVGCSPGRAEALDVRFHFNPTPDKLVDSYILEDEVALRNSTRKPACA
jgi:prepilin-type N-terminal cleavage/methylation domain-containing protein